MRLRNPIVPNAPRTWRLLRRLRADRSGATAVEFGLVMVPFLLLIMGIITVGMQYLTMHFVEYGTDSAARKLRTGEAQKAGMTIGGFRQLFCDTADVMVSCDKHLVIHIKKSATFAGLQPVTPCVTNGKLTPSAGNAGDTVRSRAGDANDAVIITVCYEWEAGLRLWSVIWNLLSGSSGDDPTVLSSTVAFRSEPFE